MANENPEEIEIDPNKPFNPMAWLDGAGNNEVIEKEEVEKKEEEDDSSEKVIEKKEEPAKPPVKGKEDNIKALRQAKEAAEKEAADLRKQIEETGDLKSFAKIRDYLKQKGNKDTITQEDIDAYIEKNRERKKSLTELEKKYQEKEELVKEFSIEHSEEWKTVYQADLQKKNDILKTTVVNVDANSNVRGPKATSAFFRDVLALNEDGTPKTALQIKARLSQLKKDFQDETGMEYEAPTLGELVKGVEELHASNAKANEARKNWKTTVEQRNRERNFEAAKKQEEMLNMELKNRDYMIRELKKGDDLEAVKEVFGDDIDISQYIDEEHTFMQKVTKGDKDVQLRGYGELVKSLGKAKAFDAAIPYVKSLQDRIKKLEGQIDSGLPPGRGKSSAKPSNEGEEGEIKLEEGKPYKPMAFLDS